MLQSLRECHTLLNRKEAVGLRRRLLLGRGLILKLALHRWYVCRGGACALYGRIVRLIGGGELVLGLLVVKLGACFRQKGLIALWGITRSWPGWTRVKAWR